jgi:hypothetical protein
MVPKDKAKPSSNDEAKLLPQRKAQVSEGQVGVQGRQRSTEMLLLSSEFRVGPVGGGAGF